MESEQKFATFISRASKGRRIGAILSWVAAAALIIALFVPGFQVGNNMGQIDGLTDMLSEGATKLYPEEMWDLTDIMLGKDMSVASYLVSYDALLDAENQMQLDDELDKVTLNHTFGIVLLVVLIALILCTIVCALFTMNALCLLTTVCAAAEIVLVYFLRFAGMDGLWPMFSAMVSQLLDTMNIVQFENGMDLVPMLCVPLIVALAVAVLVQVAGVIVHYAVHDEEEEWRGDWDENDGRDMPTGLAGEDDNGTKPIKPQPMPAQAHALAAVLVQLNTSREFQIYDNSEIILGKGSQANIIVANPVISRAHARIVCRNGVCTIEDLNSKNGTFLNDQKLNPGQPATLTSGAYITLGNEMFGYKE